ncbi:AAA family ATPase [Affinibrenneria salicis]|uniref:AAA family ATPase n=1 Tax=Affinibrenneria salicis TaxID=2590031 RepID=A0A5J5FYZ1_9GAMM|nr:AAA family ATPase [Affinibrenneria salicis]KAA8999450.1 AAA family ATPase [Affinibrenneria salicis]
MSVLGDKDRSELRAVTFAAFVQDADSKESLTRFLKASTVNDCRVERGNIDDAIAWLKKVGRSPQRLLVDIAGSSGPLDELDRLANACEPSVQVYVVGDRNDIGLYRNLLQRGVQDYLVKPLGTELLRRVLDEDDHNPVRQRRLGKAIAVVGTRGGVGTTSVAVHLARALSAGGAHRRVAYIDLDFYGGSGTSMLGLSGGNSLVEIMGNVSRLDPQYLERTLTTADNRLYALGAELDYMDPFEASEGVLGELLTTLSQHFHYVVLDVPQRGGALASEAFLHASLACVVTEPSVYSARTLVRLARHIEAHPNPATVYSIVNQTQPLNRNKVNINDFMKTVDLPVAVHIGYDAQALSLAENLAQALPERGEFARGIKQLAGILTGEAQSKPKTAWWPALRRGKTA